MKITTSTTIPARTELTVIPVREGEQPKNIPKKVQAYLEKKKKQRVFTGKKLTTTLYDEEQQVLFIGLGKEADEDLLRKAAGIAAKTARKQRVKRYAFNLQEYQEYAQAVAEGSILGLYTYKAYKQAEEDEPQDPTHLTIITNDEKKTREQAERGVIIAEGVCLARDLVNKPASEKPPLTLAKEAQRIGKKHHIKATILKKKELKAQGLNAILAVGKGSENEPALVILELNNHKKEQPTVLIGKGITFDAGGLQIKPDNAMLDMKSDMAGAATVLATMITLARLKHKGRIIGIMALAENMLGPGAYKPRDIIKAYNGTTIEVHHTDAEGRLILADALSYAEKKYKPQHIIDLATLTGASITALGYRTAALISNNEELTTTIKEASKKTDELVWELPLRNHYRNMMKSEIADIRNTAKTPHNYRPGTITAAAFLERFIKNTPWAHLDIAGPAYSYEETEYTPTGGTGWGVRLLTTMINKNR